VSDQDKAVEEGLKSHGGSVRGYQAPAILSVELLEAAANVCQPGAPPGQPLPSFGKANPPLTFCSAAGSW
jgi:hypothetical protein